MEYDFYVYAAALSKVFFFQPAGASRAVEEFGGVEEIFRLGEKQFLEKAPGAAALAGQLFDPALLEWAAREIDWCISSGIRPLCPGDLQYPRRLAECPDAPVILYTLGDADLNAAKMLAVVGTRRSTYYGREACSGVVLNLRNHCGEVTVISGLAFGIDDRAHTSSIEAGLPTVAAIPTGLDTIYPATHRDLAKKILKTGGALVTDFPRGSATRKVQFLRRNRIIAGMADCCLLGESYAKGGGLITTSLADSYGREVAAIPGRTTDPSFEGCNNLIASNRAHLVTSATDIGELMGWSAKRQGKSRHNSPAAEPEIDFGEAGACGEAILKALGESGAMSFDSIAQTVPFSVSDIAAALTTLELSGAVRENNRIYEPGRHV